MAKESITGKSKKWEWANSWWILFTFFPLGLLAFVSYIYIGKTARQIKWYIAGVVYLAAAWFVLLVPSDIVPFELKNTLYVVIWIISIIHAFLIRKQYLIRRSYIIDNKVNEKSAENTRNQVYAEMDRQLNGQKNSPKTSFKNNKKNIQRDTRLDFEQQLSNITVGKNTAKTDTQPDENHQMLNSQNASVQSAQTSVQENSANHVQEAQTSQASMSEGVPSAEKIDINHCTLQQLIALPGVSAVMAKKAEAYRNEKGRFASVEEFFEVTGLQPHFAQQIKERLVCGDAAETEKKKGRILDF